MDNLEDFDLNDFSDDDNSIKKRKVVLACDACRKKKIKCDGKEGVVCSFCKGKDSACNYTPTTSKRGPRQGYIETLEKRLELMEKLLQPLKNIELKNFQPLTTFANQSNSTTPQLSMDDSVSTDSLKLLPSFNESSPGLRELDQYILPDSSLLFPSIPSPPTPPVPKVSQDTSEHLISLYFTYQHPLLSIIHRTTFINSLQDGKHCNLLLYTIYALASRFSNHPDVKSDPGYSAGEKYIAHAKILLESSAYSTPFLTTVQALVLMSLHEFGCDRYPTAWMYSGLAVRMGQHLNLYCTDKNDNSSKMDWVEAETRRRTWFGCCLMDRLISTKTSWPMAIHDEDCQVRLPGDDYNWENSLSPSEPNGTEVYQLQPNSTHSTIPDHMYYFGHLISLMGQVNQYSNRATNSKRVDSNDEELSKLDSLLLEWYVSLPPHLQYDPQFLSSQTPETQMNSGAIVLIHVIYHSVVIVLHRSNIGRHLNLMEVIQDTNLSSKRCMESASIIASIARDATSHRFIHYVPFFPYALYTAGSIHANRAFSIDQSQALQSRTDLEIIYKELTRLEYYWGICKTYCTSLKGLYALRSSRETIPNQASNSDPMSTTVMSWLVPLKSSLHEWFPYLEKLAKDVGEEFYKEIFPQPQTNVSVHSFSSAQPNNPLPVHQQNFTDQSQGFNTIPQQQPIDPMSTNQSNSISFSNQNMLNTSDYSHLMNYNDPLFSQNLNLSSAQYQYNPLANLDSDFLTAFNGPNLMNLSLGLDNNQQQQQQLFQNNPFNQQTSNGNNMNQTTSQGYPNMSQPHSNQFGNGMN